MTTAVWNSADKSATITLSNGDLTAQATAYGFTGVRATLAKTAGKFYCEFSANAMDDNDSGIGVVLASASLGGLRKGGAGPIVYTTVIYNNFGGPGSVLTNIVGNTLCMAVDLDARKAWFRTNNGNWNGSPSDDPATGAGGIDYSSYISAGASMMPGMAASTPTMATTGNFGASAYSYTPPSGYGNWADDPPSSMPSSEPPSSMPSSMPSSEPPSSTPDCTWNPVDTSAEIDLSSDLLSAQVNPSELGYFYSRATRSHARGKYYFELNIDEINQGNQIELFGVGRASIDPANFTAIYNGNADSSGFIEIGLHGGGGHFTMSNITIGVAVDLNTRKVRFKVRANGYTFDWIGGSGTLPAGEIFPTLLLRGWGFTPPIPPIVTANFGASGFVFEIPGDFQSWDGLQGASSSAANLLSGGIVIAAGAVGSHADQCAISADAAAFDFGGTLPTFDNGAAIGWKVCPAPELGIFVAYAKDAPDVNRQIRISRDYGQTWESVTSPANNAWESITWCRGLGLFIAVASTGTNRVMTSPDGENWTLQTAASASVWKAVAWSEELGLAVAVGTNAIMKSSNGTTWTTVTSPADRQWYAIAWGVIQDSIGEGSGLFVAIANNASGSNDYMTSATGSTFVAGDSGNAGSFEDICFSDELEIFLAVQSTGSGYALRFDGTTWATSSPSPSQAWVGCGWSQIGQCFVIVTTDAIATSPNGDAPWTALTSPGSRGWRSVAELVTLPESPSSLFESFLASSAPSSEPPSSVPSSLPSSAPSSLPSSAPSSEPPSSVPSSAPSSAPPDLPPPIQTVVVTLC